jgi:pyridoxine 4-dehydrogenase
MNKEQILSAAAAGTFTLGGDLTVNRMGYGAMRITGEGVWGPPADKAAALATLRRAIDFGVNLIDTADSYGPGTSEELIAEALYPYPTGLVIATKGGWERPGPGQWTHNASPKHLTEALEGSLKRLRLECIDVYQLHAPDNAVSFEASVEALAGLRKQGKIRHVALSNVTREHVECKTDTASPTGNRTSSSTIVSRIRSLSFRGLRSVKRRRHMMPLRKSQAILMQLLCRSPWPGCLSVPK